MASQKNEREHLLLNISSKAVLHWPASSEPGLLDLSAGNRQLQDIDLKNEAAFSSFIAQEMKRQNSTVLVGGYLENRVVYQRSEVFGGEEARSVHLGVDIWAPADTRIYTPLDGKIHSFRNNDAFGDYGPTLLLEHSLENFTLYSLYGHLAAADLANWQVGQGLKAGDCIGHFGAYEENGNWPPHLHFQLMYSLEGKSGDYPGVAAPSQLAHYKANCPNPNLLLRLPILEKTKARPA